MFAKPKSNQLIQLTPSDDFTFISFTIWMNVDPGSTIAGNHVSNSISTGKYKK